MGLLLTANAAIALYPGSTSSYLAEVGLRWHLYVWLLVSKDSSFASTVLKFAVVSV